MTDPQPFAWSDGLVEGGFGSPRAAAALSWPARIARMLEVEAALARAQARLGLLDDDTAAAVARACDPDLLDLPALTRRAAESATPVIPLLAAVREVASPAAADALHLGATSQDIVDTAMVLATRDVLAVLDGELQALGDVCAQLADRHRTTVVAGRTLGQQAVPTTYGLKAARWLGAVDRRRAHLARAARGMAVLQLGGAAGTLGAYGEVGLDLADALAAELGLAVPDLPWHAERDRIAELAGALAAVASVAAKIAGDVVLLSQTEVAEVRETGQQGPGSSAMPHKRNPVDATAARAAARLAAGEVAVLLHAAGDHEHERAAGAWQAEWVALPGALVRTLGAVERVHRALAHLEVDAARALANLDAGSGLTATAQLAAALAPTLGQPGAQTLVGELAARATEEGRQLEEVAATDERVGAVLDGPALTTALAPATSLALTDRLVDRALATHRRGVDDTPEAGR